MKAEALQQYAEIASRLAKGGNFRRQVQMVNASPSSSIGRKRKDRRPSTGYYVRTIHDRMRAIAHARERYSQYAVSVSDIYNEAARLFILDIHFLLGEDLLLPPEVKSLADLLRLRERIERPIGTPLSELVLEGEPQRTTLYFDQFIWESLLELSLHFGVQLNQLMHVHRLVELCGAWYLAGFDKPPASAGE